jgi:hypothetical protein
MHRTKMTVEELEAIGLQRINTRPGCRGVRSITLTLDESGEWSFGAYDPGSVENVELVRWATFAVSHQMHDEFDLVTDR